MKRETSIEHLKRDLAAGRVVVVSGVGVSVAAAGGQQIEGYPVASWTGLLCHGLAQCEQDGLVTKANAGVLRSQLESGEPDFLLAAADTITQRMKVRSEGTFRGWLKETLGRLELHDRALPDALAALPALHASLALDDLLARAADRRPVTWLHPDAVQDVLRGAAPDAVLHPHGCYREPASVALGLRSFLPARDQPHARAVLDLFALDRTLLFVGCGDALADPTFARLLEWAREALHDVAPRHYLLCRDVAVADVQKQLAGAPWLRPLAYGDDDRDLVSFLRGLVPAGGPDHHASPPSPAPPGARPGAPCKVLFLASNPMSTARLALDDEARDIEEKLRASRHRDCFSFKTRWSVRADDLVQALNEDRPTIVHFSGHGAGAPGLVLHGGEGGTRQVRAETLRRLLATLKDDIRVVVLNACYSVEQARAIAEVVDCVVGMNDAVGDDAARRFAASFYRALGFGRSVQNAFDQGLLAIELDGLDEATTPKLLVRAGVKADEVWVAPRA